MSRRRRTDLWDDFFEAMRWLFTVIHPAWSILIAAGFFFGPVLWFKYKVNISQFQVFGYILGGIPAFLSLAAGVAGWR